MLIQVCVLIDLIKDFITGKAIKGSKFKSFKRFAVEMFVAIDSVRFWVTDDFDIII